MKNRSNMFQLQHLPLLKPEPRTPDSGIGVGVMATEDEAVKSIPVHCVVEQVGRKECTKPSPGPGATPPSSSSSSPSSTSASMELDTYAILPSSTPFGDLVRTALVKIGYNASEAIGAKGAIQVKNWKSLNFDSITENPNSTLEEILGDLTSVTTLKIRLCGQSKVTAMEDVKEKLLQFMLERSQGMLSSFGCPIERALLSSISRGDYTMALPDETREAFNKWYKDQTGRLPKGVPTGRPPVKSMETPPRLTVTPAALSTPTSNGQLPFMIKPESSPGVGSQQFSRTRMRTSFDPEMEIPRLQKWFQTNQHPSREQMVGFLNELNSQEGRKGRKPLDLTNIVYWFKNARAAQRRATKSMDTSMEEGDASVEPAENDDDHLSTSSAEQVVEVPELPNRNAIYVVQPLHLHRKSEDRIEVVRMNEEEEESEAEASDAQQPCSSPHRDYSHAKENGLAHDPESGSMMTEERNNNIVPMEQEEATDLSIRSCGRKPDRDDDDGGDYQKVLKIDLNASGTSCRSEKENEDYYSGSSAASTPSPPTFMPHHLSQHQHQQQQQQQQQGMTIPPQHALQMAAMSHALNIGYLPTSLYGSPMVALKESAHSPNGSESASDRKKRSRVFIDPLSEIPKLEKWFLEDTHPSSYMIEKYTEELNKSAYRQRFPRLEPKNVQLWFKNHRAKVKRQRLEGPSP